MTPLTNNELATEIDRLCVVGGFHGEALEVFSLAAARLRELESEPTPAEVTKADLLRAISARWPDEPGNGYVKLNARLSHTTYLDGTESFSVDHPREGGGWSPVMIAPTRAALIEKVRQET